MRARQGSALEVISDLIFSGSGIIFQSGEFYRAWVFRMLFVRYDPGQSPHRILVIFCYRIKGINLKIPTILLQFQERILPGFAGEKIMAKFPAISAGQYSP